MEGKIQEQIIRVTEQLHSFKYTSIHVPGRTMKLMACTTSFMPVANSMMGGGGSCIDIFVFCIVDLF